MAKSKYIERVRSEIVARDRLVTVCFGRAQTPGVFTIEAYHADFPPPIAIVWFSWTGLETVAIQQSFVMERFRRCGLRTLLHEKLLEWMPSMQRITTGSATASGRAWLKAAGFRSTNDGWEFRRRRN